jgi:hypothetical protein
VSIPSLHKLLVEALGDLYNFDSRLWRSLGLLLFKPGRLTREYLEGRRARYVPPFRLYVVLSLLFFFLLAVLPDFDDGDEPPVIIRGAAAPETPAPATEGETAAPATSNESAAVAPGPRDEPESAPFRFGIETTDDGEDGWSCMELGGMENWSPEIRARVERSCERITADNGSSFGRAILENVPLMMFLFIPIVAAGMKVLYPLARRKYVEHLLFFLHFHALFFLIATLGLLVSVLAGLVPALETLVVVLGVVGWGYLPIYLFLAMRHVYAQDRLTTTFKFVLLSGGYFFALLVTFIGIVFYTALTL